MYGISTAMPTYSIRTIFTIILRLKLPASLQYTYNVVKKMN